VLGSRETLITPLAWEWVVGVRRVVTLLMLEELQ
jgi:hypothetical protein